MNLLDWLRTAAGEYELKSPGYQQRISLQRSNNQLLKMFTIKLL